MNKLIKLIKITTIVLVAINIAFVILSAVYFPLAIYGIMQAEIWHIIIAAILLALDVLFSCACFAFYKLKT